MLPPHCSRRLLSEGRRLASSPHSEYLRQRPGGRSSSSFTVLSLLGRMRDRTLPCRAEANEAKAGGRRAQSGQKEIGRGVRWRGGGRRGRGGGPCQSGPNPARPAHARAIAEQAASSGTGRGKSHDRLHSRLASLTLSYSHLCFFILNLSLSLLTVAFLSLAASIFLCVSGLSLRELLSSPRALSLPTFQERFPGSALPTSGEASGQRGA